MNIHKTEIYQIRLEIHNMMSSMSVGTIPFLNFEYSTSKAFLLPKT